VDVSLDTVLRVETRGEAMSGGLSGRTERPNHETLSPDNSVRSQARTDSPRSALPVHFRTDSHSHHVERPARFSFLGQRMDRLGLAPPLLSLYLYIGAHSGDDKGMNS
jgi:hypothetical protein